MSKEDIIICRCNDVTLEEIEDLIDMGVTNIEMIRRLAKTGIGPCQGRSCLPMLVDILVRKTGKTPEQFGFPATRAPIMPVQIGVLAYEE